LPASGPANPVTIRQLADEFKDKIARLRITARDTAITTGLRLRSKNGRWRFFLVTPAGLAGIDRDGKLFLPGSGPMHA
jgi:hypothetical protein